MRLLVDTHAFLWWVAGSARLTEAARRALSDENAEALISAATAWEITTKFRIGKLPEYAAVAADVPKTIRERGFTALEISVEHAQYAGALPGAHGDPFDRMLAAQALLEGLTLITNDSDIKAFGVKTLW